MNKTIKLLSLFVSLFGTFSCGGIKNNANKNFPDSFYKNINYTEQYRFEEYYCKKTHETLRICDKGYVEYSNDSYSFTVECSFGDEYISIFHRYEETHDLLIMKKDSNTLKQIDSFSYLTSGFSLSNRSFELKGTFNENVLYYYNNDKATSFYLTMMFTNNNNSIKSFADFSKAYNLNNYSNDCYQFDLLTYSNLVSVCYKFDINLFKSRMDKLCHLKRKSNCVFFNCFFESKQTSYVNIRSINLDDSNKLNDVLCLYTVLTFGTPSIFIDNRYLRFDSYQEYRYFVDSSSFFIEEDKKFLDTITDEFFLDNSIVFAPLIERQNIVFSSYFKNDILYLIYKETINAKVLTHYWGINEYYIPVLSIPKSLTFNSVISL